MKKKIASPKIPLRFARDERRVPIRSFIEGIVYRLRRGRNNLNVRRPEILYIVGNSVRKDVTTTRKSSQFHGSLR
jgi:hypothetical protein